MTKKKLDSIHYFDKMDPISRIFERILVWGLLGFIIFFSIGVPSYNPVYAGDNESTTTILFFGDSITAGYGLNADQAFPALIADRADSLGYDIETVNAGVSGETSAGGLRRVDWILQRPFDVFVLELGGNDALRGIDPEHTRENLHQIILKVSEERPETQIVLAGMEAPPNMGQEYSQSFRNIYPYLAERHDVAFMPFILDGVAGEPELNLPDGIHPTAEGHRIIADNLWQVLEPLLKEDSEYRP